MFFALWRLVTDEELQWSDGSESLENWKRRLGDSGYRTAFREVGVNKLLFVDGSLKWEK